MRLTARGRRGRARKVHNNGRKAQGAGGRGAGDAHAQGHEHEPAQGAARAGPEKPCGAPASSGGAGAALTAPPRGARCPRLAFYSKIAPRAPGGGSCSPLTWDRLSRFSLVVPPCSAAGPLRPRQMRLPSPGRHLSPHLWKEREASAGEGAGRSGAWSSPATRFGRSLNDFAATRCRAAWCFC